MLGQISQNLVDRHVHFFLKSVQVQSVVPTADVTEKLRFDRCVRVLVIEKCKHCVCSTL